MPVRLEISGIEPIRERMKAFPRKFNALMIETLKTALVDLQGSIPPYPVQQEDSTYVRTGTLGRTLGASQYGKPEGKPDIFEVRQEGDQKYAGYFGTRLDYAPHVIGYKTQAEVHKGRWWTIMTIARRARPRIQKRFQTLAERLAKWLATK